MRNVVIVTFILLSAGSLAAQEQPPAKPAWLTLGPYLQFTSPDAALVRWRTAPPMASVLEYVCEGRQHVEDPAPKTEHALAMTGLQWKAAHAYWLLGPEGERSGTYECETDFNYTVPPVPNLPSPFASDSLPWDAAADRILSQTGILHGYCVVIGAGKGALAYALAKRSALYVHVMETNETAVAQTRQALLNAQAYGSRVSVHAVKSYEALPLNRCFANLVISLTPCAKETILPYIRPLGGLALMPPTDAVDLDAIAAAYAEGRWETCTQKAIDGAGQWSHQYGSPDNSARSGEALQGATRTDQLYVQWVGQPGPRAMVDRNPRGPAPLYAHGCLFTQGMHRIITQDAYNGTILWSLEIPDLQRYNMPRDCGNWCADDASLYAAVGNACWRLDAATGALQHVYPVFAPDAAPYDWGYIARVGVILLGSAARKGTAYQEFRGKDMSGWYDAALGPVTYKVGSDALFALDTETGSPRWSYSDGIIINSTITIADDTAYFAECRTPAVKAEDGRRLDPEGLWEGMFLVALDRDTGAKRWEHPYTGPKGNVVFFMLHANNTLIVAASDSKYNLSAYDPASGALRWEAYHSWTGDNHSGHMQHPAVVGNVIYLEPCGYDLATGKRVTDAVGRHEGCATYAATEGALLYRGNGRCTSLWDTQTCTTTSWNRLRPSCWLSTIAGGGMVLSPEGGGGCSCGGWMETSIGFMKKEQ
ncbi:MAG TPA: PQQ-binding-like beta-propeller repeat protein [Candidatus Hydrogenedentes bacterium]|nr:PQQ-binding-like beta-propeller repeat protein [Candidatus Hydrogenedentota bacterium]